MFIRCGQTRILPRRQEHIWVRMQGVMLRTMKLYYNLIKSKCKHILLYGLEVFPLNESQLNSLDFVVNLFFMKLFKTNSMPSIEFCREQFNFVLLSHQIATRHAKIINSEAARIDLYV